MTTRAAIVGLSVMLAGGAGAETNLALKEQVRQAESGGGSCWTRGVIAAGERPSSKPSW